MGRNDFTKPSGVKTSKQLTSNKPLKGPTLLSGSNAVNQANQKNAAAAAAVNGGTNKNFPAGGRN